MRDRGLVVGVVAALLLAGCAGEEPAAPPPPRPRDKAALEAALAADPKDVFARFELAHLLEAEGRFDLAIREYGACINLTTRGTLTTPVVDLAKLHHRLGNLAPAERLYRDVLGTFPSDTRLLRDNPDYKDAARGLRALLVARGGEGPAGREEGALADLRLRFVHDFGGDEASWLAPPEWLRPRPAGPAPGGPAPGGPAPGPGTDVAPVRS